MSPWTNRSTAQQHQLSQSKPNHRKDKQQQAASLQNIDMTVVGKRENFPADGAKNEQPKFTTSSRNLNESALQRSQVIS